MEVPSSLQCNLKLSHLPDRPQVDIEFQDLSYTVPDGPRGSKYILRNVNGCFKSGHLTAILGPSGAGKSTLLNVLAGYNCRGGASGLVLMNGEPRNLRQFRQLSRYIMQEDMLQPRLTVHESMLVAADLKLSRELSREDKLTAVAEILEMLRLTRVKDTPTERLSGGERKRLSISLELVNNPPVIFLDEPTTGLDDLSSSQCVQLLRLLAEGGRTVICSVHTPSARLFAMFDHVYVVANGHCVYQGPHDGIVPYLKLAQLDCPTHYNPADFIIEVASGEYGNYLEKLVSLADEQRSTHRSQSVQNPESNVSQGCQNTENNSESPYRSTTKEKVPKFDSTGWTQFKILCSRMLMQKYRDPKYVALNISLYVFIGLMIGVLFLGMGNDGSKTLFNFGFCFTCIIVFMYCPLLPVLLNFPFEVQLLKREYFNRWYDLPAYFWAVTVVNAPIQFILGSIYSSLVLVLTDQPLEPDRIAMFITTCFLIALISEAIGMAISSTLNIVNGMFVGPVLIAPLMLLAVYGLGSGSESIPFIVRMMMSLSYLRYGLEGIVAAIYGGDRTKIPCPESEEFCLYSTPSHLLSDMGMENVAFWFDISMLFGMFVLLKAVSFYLLRQRLSPNKTFAAMHVIGRIVKSHFSMSK